MSSPGSDLHFLRVIGKVTSLLWVSLSVIWIHACSRPQQQSSVKATSGADGNQQEYMMPLGPPLGKANNLRSWSLASPLCFSSLKLIKFWKDEFSLKHGDLSQIISDAFYLPNLGIIMGETGLKDVPEYCWHCCCYAWGSQAGGEKI